MDHRIKAQLAKRKAASSRREKAQKETTILAYGNAWAIIVFVNGEGFRIRALYNTKDEAEEAARQETRMILDNANYTKAPYSAVFATPVERPTGAPKYKRGTEYYAVLRAASGGQTHARAVFLFTTEAEAQMASEITADYGPERRLTVIGGPISLKQNA